MKAAVIVILLMIFSMAWADEIRYDKGGRRDPFVPLRGFTGEDGTTGDKTLTLEGIVYDPKGSSYVVINGEVYREGEEVGGGNLIRILQDRVVLQRIGQETVIWLHEEILDRTLTSPDEPTNRLE